MTEVRFWTVARSGAAMTVNGTGADGKHVKLAGVKKITPSLQRKGVCIAYMLNGDSAFLLPAA